MKHVAVLGAGAWGTALAKLLAEKGNRVTLWAIEPDVAESVSRAHENRYLPGVALPELLSATTDPEKALAGASMVVLVIPSHATRGALREVAKLLPPGVPLVSATKGIENDSLMLMHEVLRDELGDERLGWYTALSGPSFAKEVALRHPTAVVVAGNRADVVASVQAAFSSDVFRAYSSDDLVGVEIGGALKNVIAIAAGAADGLGFGFNTRAALITRGLAEIARVAVAKGASPLTIAGLAGMGDLVLTCTGELSRNRTIGFELGRGKRLEDAIRALGHVAEGVKTAQSARDLSVKLGVDMPITEQVHLALFADKPARDVVSELMGRALRPEIDFA